MSFLLTTAYFSEAQKADIIIINGKVSTLDSAKAEAEAVAITANKIVTTGTNTQVLKLKGKADKDRRCKRQQGDPRLVRQPPSCDPRRSVF